MFYKFCEKEIATRAQKEPPSRWWRHGYALRRFSENRSVLLVLAFIFYRNTTFKIFSFPGFGILAYLMPPALK